MSDDLLMQLLGEVRETRAEVAAIKDDVAEVKQDVKETRRQTTRTNGRVTALELWRHGLAAVAESRSWIKPWVLGVASGVVVAAITVGLTLAAAAVFT